MFHLLRFLPSMLNDNTNPRSTRFFLCWFWPTFEIKTHMTIRKLQQDLTAWEHSSQALGILRSPQPPLQSYIIHIAIKAIYQSFYQSVLMCRLVLVYIFFPAIMCLFAFQEQTADHLIFVNKRKAIAKKYYERKSQSKMHCITWLGRYIAPDRRRIDIKISLIFHKIYVVGTH